MDRIGMGLGNICSSRWPRMSRRSTPSLYATKQKIVELLWVWCRVCKVVSAFFHHHPLIFARVRFNLLTYRQNTTVGRSFTGIGVADNADSQVELSAARVKTSDKEETRGKGRETESDMGCEKLAETMWTAVPRDEYQKKTRRR